MSKNNKHIKKSSLSYKIGVLIIVTELIAFAGLGFFYIEQFTSQIENDVEQKFQSPGYLMSKGLLRYESAEDKVTMEKLVGETIEECIIIGVNGIVYYSLNEELRDKTKNDITQLAGYQELNQEIEKTAFLTTFINDERYLITIDPLHMEGGKFLGHLFIKAKMERIEQQKRSTILMFIIGSLLCMVLSSVAIILMFNRYFTKNINKILLNIGEMAQGKLVKEIKIKSRDEIGRIIESINRLIDGISKRTKFSDEIAKGNLDAEYEALSADDVMGNSLMNMQKSLQKARHEEEERNKEVEKQNWTTTGLANFANILRQDNDNIEALSYNVIKNITKYLGANQGAIFVLKDNVDDEDLVYEMTAAIAYERRKMMEKQIPIGEGLIGRAAYEKLSIYLTEVPDGYINITSGLGTATPNCILIVPLILKEEVLGVIEIASFNKFEKHQIEFVEKIGENIASTLASVRINQRTAQLLHQSQHQGEELAAQEEEMRQNLEELVATQEEAGRKTKEMDSLWNAVKVGNMVVVYDLNGNVVEANQSFTDIFAGSSKTILNMNFNEIESELWTNSADQINFWQELKSGSSKKRTIQININGVETKVLQTYAPIYDESGAPAKILNISMIAEG